MIAALAFVCLAPVQEPPKWEEILSNMHRDIRTEKGVYEEWKLDATSRDGEKTEATLRRWLDGKRFRQEVESDGTIQLATSSDGVNEWTVMRPAGFYVQHETISDPFSAKWKGTSKTAPNDASMNVGVKDGYDISMEVSPLPEISKVEVTDDERTVHATVKTDDRTLNITLRLEKDKWLLKEFLGKSSDGKATMSLKRVKAQRNQTFGADRFALEPKLTENLKELSGEEREQFIRSLRGEGG